MRTAIRTGMTPEQLQIKLNQLETILDRYAIAKIPSIHLDPAEFEYQIDQRKLEDSIKELYQRQNGRPIDTFQQNQIDKDVDSISNIFKIRKRNRALSLKGCKAVFATNNSIIAFAAKIFEREQWKYTGSIPVCVTDLFLSAILWANYPDRNDKLNLKRLISECYAITELDSRLLNKFYEDINKMHREHTLSDDQYYLLSASNLTFSLLEEKTLNDLDEYTDQTAAEILEEMELRMYKNLEAEKRKNEVVVANLRSIGRLIGKSFFLIIAVLVILAVISLKFVAPQSTQSPYYRGTLLVLTILTSIFGVLRWMDVIPTKTKIEANVSEWVFNFLNEKLNCPSDNTN